MVSNTETQSHTHVASLIPPVYREFLFQGGGLGSIGSSAVRINGSIAIGAKAR